MGALDIGLLPRGTRIDVEGFDLEFLEPVFDGVSDEFRPVVAAKMLRRAIDLHGLIDRFDDIGCPDRPAWVDRQTLPCILINRKRSANPLRLPP